MAIRYGVGMNSDGTYYGYVQRGTRKWVSENVADKEEAMRLAKEESGKN